MRIRDIFIVCVGIVFFIIGWHQEGDLSVFRGFKISVTDIEVQKYVMCRPVVVDLKGDGRPVLLASTNYGLLEMFQTHRVRGDVGNRYIPTTPFLVKTFFSRVVAIGVGKLHNKSDSHAIFVVTDDFRLHRLSPTDFSEMWEVTLSNSWVETYHAAISIVPERINEKDEGTVIVAMRVPGPNETQVRLFAAFNSADGGARWHFTSDSENAVEEVLGNSGLSAGGVLLENTTVVMQRSKTNDFRSREKPWTFFREAVMTALPHRYAHPWDEQLHPHIFFHVKNRKKRNFRAGNRVVVKYKDRFVRMEKEDYGALGEKLDVMSLRTATSKHDKGSYRRRPSNALVFHGKNGLEVLHLYTGNVITRVSPLKSGTVMYHDINDDFQIDAIETLIGPRMQVYSRHGVDLIDDCLGGIYSGIPVAHDHLYNATICDTEGFLGRLDLIHHFIDGDVRGEETPHSLNTLELIGSRNVVSKNTRSVTPLVVQLHTSKGRGLFLVERRAVFMIDTGLVTCVDPSRHRVIWRSQTDAFFPGLREAEEAEVGLTGLSVVEKTNRARTFPHLAPYSFYQTNEETVGYVGGGSKRYESTDPFIIAVGERYLNVMSTKSGRVLRTIELEYPPVAPVIVQDFNGDGINDIIVVTAEGVYGFVITSQASSDTVTALMLLMVGVLAVLFFVREVGAAEASDAEMLLPTSRHDVHQSSRKVGRRATD